MKKIHWFTVPNTVLTNSNTISITDTEIVKQISKVLRLEVGEEVVLKTQQTAFIGVLSLVSRNEVIVSELVEKERNQSYKKVSLFFCIPKKDKFELILEKCTEIGVTDFYPVISDRTIKTNINIERSEKIIQEASEQAQRIDTPTLHAIQSIDDIVKQYRPAVFDVEGESLTRPSQEGENPALHIQNILIGPEGGFTLRELDLFRDLRLDIYKVGETVLKTETAAIVVSGLLLN
jgi:16S rRNA (uracil1498-N3)-methyltransferase